MPAMPLFIDIAGCRVIVVGGGSVGLRKLAAARAAGAFVRVVALEPQPADLDPSQLEWIAEPYRDAHLTGGILVFAAAGDAVNLQVVADARARGLWVCDASQPMRGNATVPAIHHTGQLAIAVSTNGASPILARQIRDRLVESLDPLLASWVELLDESRALAKELVLDPSARRRLFEELAAWRWLDHLRAFGVARTREVMREAVQAAGRSV